MEKSTYCVKKTSQVAVGYMQQKTHPAAIFSGWVIVIYISKFTA